VPVTTIDPSTGQALHTYEETSDQEIDEILDSAHGAASRWRETPVEDRSGALRRFASELREGAQDLSALATREMGKPIRESKAEVEKCAFACEWFADHGPGFLEAEPVVTEAVRTEVVFTPLGVLFAIMPWNFPYWQVTRALAPAVSAGNVVVLKHAPSTTGCALALAEVARAAGLPEGVFSVVVAGVEQTPAVSERIIVDDRVAAVTLTGSTGAGRAVAAISGRALKKTVLELGGSDPFIVLDDADLEAAAAHAVRSRFQNTGQSCIATKRIFLEEPIAKRFTELFTAGVKALRVGDPTDPATDLGPLARSDLRDAVDRQVGQSVKLGARVLTGGARREGPGFFFEPTVLDMVTREMPVMNEEVFGPAVPLVTVDDEHQAVDAANDTTFGLGSNVWTSDLERGEALAKRLNAGHTAVNGLTVSDPRLPFGGVRDSGYGRELSRFGIHEFVNIHSVVVEGPAGPVGRPVQATE
jgi:succinate-semialdehyde dehydrogenase / glutarate-semialdehyde dehydrogenase